MNKGQNTHKVNDWATTPHHHTHCLTVSPSAITEVVSHYKVGDCTDLLPGVSQYPSCPISDHIWSGPKTKIQSQIMSGLIHLTGHTLDGA